MIFSEKDEFKEMAIPAGKTHEVRFLNIWILSIVNVKFFYLLKAVHFDTRFILKLQIILSILVACIFFKLLYGCDGFSLMF